MKAIAKLKDRARKHEQKEDWQAAIDAYQAILEAEEAEDSVDVELGLYNRIGDLYLRLGQTDDAVKFYEAAADKYAESGFFNNAIALCNKALRHRPERPETYLRLSRLCAEQGFLPDARRWIVDYAERQVKRGAVEAAISGLSDFADETGDPDVRELLAKHLASHNRAGDAIEQLRRAYVALAERGETDGAARVATQAARIDPSVDLAAEAPPVRAAAAELEVEGGPAGLDPGGAADTGPLPGLDGMETHRRDEVETGAGMAAGGLEGLESTFGGVEEDDAGTGEEAEAPEAEPEPLPMLDSGFDEESAEEAEPLPMLDMSGPEKPTEAVADEEEDEVEKEEAAEAEEAAEEAVAEEAADEAAEEAAEEAALIGLDLGGVFETDGGDVAAGEPAPADSVDFGAGFGFDLGTGEDVESPEDSASDIDVDAILQRAKELVGRALPAEALRELRMIAGSRAGAETFEEALAITDEIIRHNPDDMAALQARAAFAARTGDRMALVDAYLDLAEGLDRIGAEVKAKALYERVLDVDPSNEIAREALGAPPPADDETVDLDAILREMAPEAGVTAATTQEADAGLAAMLSSFKARVTDQPTSDDAGDHYDLGLAFKEMGLVDEAIAEFQTALTGGEERLKVYEELGQCFIQKGQFNVAIKVFNRAIQAPRQEDSDLLGVYYHLGHCFEELGQRAEAREAYEKVLSIDPTFEDVPNRVARL